MATVLRSVWKSPKSLLAFKGGLFGLSFLYSPWLAVPMGLWLYFKPLFYHSFTLLRLFCVFLIIVITTSVSWLSAVVFGFLFFVILGLKNLIFIRRRYWRLLLVFSLFYLVFLNFFLINQSSFFALKWLGTVFLLVLLMQDLIRALITPVTANMIVAGWLSAFLLGQAVWIISWLPIGFLNSANLAVIMALLLVDLNVNYFWGTLRRGLIVKDLALFLVLFLIILGTSQWKL